MKKNHLLSFIIFCVCASSASAQVAIGADQLDSLAVLEIISSDKGVLFPRLNTVQRDALIVTSADSARLAISGMMIFNTDEDCYNYWNRTEKLWQSLCGALGKAELHITDCSEIVVGGAGDYRSTKNLTEEHYLLVPVKVTRPGTYIVSAIPDPTNGYYFMAEGEFLDTCEVMLKLPATGKPLNYTVPEDDMTAGDLIKITINGEDSGCNNLRIHIINGINPEFIMNCGSGKYQGVYAINTALNSSNTLTINVTNVNVIAGAKIILQTDEVDGMSFISDPVAATSGLQTITLKGHGTPGTAGTKIFTIRGNSGISNTTCQIKLIVVMRPKRIGVIAYSDATYGYNFAQNGLSTMENGGAGVFVRDARNFGTLAESVVQIQQVILEPRWSGVVINAADLAAWLSPTNSNRPDAVFLLYSAGWSAGNDNASICRSFRDYVQGGNPLIVFGDNNGVGQTAHTSWENLIDTIFGTSAIDVSNSSSTAFGVMRFQDKNHPVLNGPFGDVRSKYWGEDSSYPQVVQNLPTAHVTILSDSWDWSRNQDGSPTGITGFVHNDYPFLFVGDGGFTSHDGATSATACPYKLDATHFPIPKLNYGLGSTRYPVYNSIFFGNVLAWAMKYVEGIE